MPDSLQKVIQQLGEIWRHLGVNQKASIVIALLTVMGLVGFVMHQATRPDYRILYSGLSLEDAASMRETLEEEKIAHQLRDSGHALYVRQQDVYRCRLLLAREGLPKKPGTGFELFEKQSFGLTDFAQKVNYQRALQGELARTITSIEGISGARVSLVLPKDKLLRSAEEKKARASILLTASSGAALGPAQVNSIVHMVSSSVQGLSPGDVTVVDQYGKLLNKSSGDQPFEEANEQLDIKEQIEVSLTRKAQEMLDTALGVGNSIVRVNAEMDFSKIEQRKENFEKKGRVASSETIETSSSKTPNPVRGTAGVVANVPVETAQPTIEQSMAETKEENIKSEYLVPSSVEHSVKRGARIANLSVSVCVAQGENPRPPEDLKKIEMIVANAVGIVRNGMRSDSIYVEEILFPAPVVEPGLPWYTYLPFRYEQLEMLVAGMIVLIFAVIVFRKVMTALVVQQEEVGVPVGALTAGEKPVGMGAGAGEEEEEEDLPLRLPPGAETDPLVIQLTKLAERSPRSVAAWITSSLIAEEAD